jgi:DNA repair protein RecO (recombination protein O)
MCEAFGRADSIDTLARYFEFWLLRLEGVYPSVDRCPRCDGRLDRGAVLVAGERAYVCGDCTDGSLRLSEAALSFLRDAVRRTPAEIGAGGAPVAVLREIGRVHERLIAMHLEKELRSTRVVQELRPEP